MTSNYNICKNNRPISRLRAHCWNPAPYGLEAPDCLYNTSSMWTSNRRKCATKMTKLRAQPDVAVQHDIYQTVHLWDYTPGVNTAMLFGSRLRDRAPRKHLPGACVVESLFHLQDSIFFKLRHLRNLHHSTGLDLVLRWNVRHSLPQHRNKLLCGNHMVWLKRAFHNYCQDCLVVFWTHKDARPTPKTATFACHVCSCADFLERWFIVLRDI